MQTLDGRVAVVTGAASGIGLALSRRFAEEGMKVVLADVEERALERAIRQLESEGQREVLGVACDVRFQESVQAVADAALAEFGAVHLVCNNAGVARAPGGGAMWEVDLSDWSWILGVNVMGVVHGIRAFVPILLEQDEGHVVNTSSGNGGLSPLRGLPIYAASKSAVTQISECLYGQLAALTDKVHVSVFYPFGALDTGLWSAERNRPADLPRSRPRPAQSFDGLRRHMQAAGRELQAQDPAELAAFVVDGIRADRFWLLKEGDPADAAIRTRAESMLARSNPEYMARQPRALVLGGMGEEGE